MKTLLSTKVLSAPQRELILNAGIGVVAYNAIQIHHISLQDPDDLKGYQNYIITSKNAFKSIQNTALRIQNCFCVGTKTKELLEKEGINVVAMAPSAIELAALILEKYRDKRFLFLCGNLRREELPEILLQNEVDFEEKRVYETRLNRKKFDRRFDGVLFFSPSGVKSYITNNRLDQAISFCIGETTASEARKHTDKIVVANRPTFDNVIVQAIKYFKN